MRRVKGPAPGQVREYIPAAYDNRKDVQPVKVWLRNPTEAEKREVVAVGGGARFAVGKDGAPLKDKDGNPIITIDVSGSVAREHAIIERFVDKVESYTAANGEPIKTGDDLAKHGEPEFVTEIAAEIMRALSLSEAERKNSDGSSVSSGAATLQSTQTVTSAESPATGSTSTVTAPVVPQYASPAV